MTKSKRPRQKFNEAEAFEEPKGEVEMPPEIETDLSPDARQTVHAIIAMTGLEKKLYRMLGGEKNPWGLMPQCTVHGYRVDFYAPQYNLVVEADGPEHLDTTIEDEKRDANLLEHGIIVLRLAGADLAQLNTQKLFNMIEEFIHPRHIASLQEGL